MELNPLNEEQRHFTATGSAAVKDRQGEIVPMDRLKKIMPVYMERGGTIIDSHSNRPVGRCLNYEFIEEDGVEKMHMLNKIFNNYAIDDEVWDKIKKGKYSGMSLGGGSTASDGVLGDIEIYEFSPVDRPANQLANIKEVNMIAKSDVQKPCTEDDNIKPSNKEETQMENKKEEVMPEATTPAADPIAELKDILMQILDAVSGGAEKTIEQAETIEEETDEAAPVEEDKEKQLAADVRSPVDAGEKTDGEQVVLPKAQVTGEPAGQEEAGETDKVNMIEKNLNEVTKTMKDIQKKLSTKSTTPRPGIRTEVKKSARPGALDIARGKQSWETINNMVKEDNKARLNEALSGAGLM